MSAALSAFRAARRPSLKGQTASPGQRLDFKMRRDTAFEVHRPTTIGKARLVGNEIVQAGHAPRPIGVRLRHGSSTRSTRVVNQAAATRIVAQYRLCDFTLHIGRHADTAPSQFIDPIHRPGALVETQRHHILAAGAAEQMPHARPEHGPQAHGAWLGAGDQFAQWNAIRPQVMGAKPLLRQRQRNHLGVRG